MTNEPDFGLSARQGFDELAERVRAELGRALAEAGLNTDIDPDRVYLNGVNNLDERLVIYSQSLTDETTRRILEQDPPSLWTQDTFGVFFVPYSFADEHRVPEHSARQMSELIATVYARLS